MRNDIFSKTQLIAFFFSFIVTTLTIFLVFFAKDIAMNLIPKPKATVVTTDVSYIDTFTVINSVIKNNSEYVLIDTRDKKSFAKAHIKNSINLPVASILESRYDKKHLDVQSKNIVLVVLSYSMFSTDGELTQKKLMKDGYKSFILKAGWNEIFNLPNMWVPEASQTQFSSQNKYIDFAE